MEKNSSISLMAIFAFYNIATGVQARLAFNKDFKHCNVIVYDGLDLIILDFDATGILARRIRQTDSVTNLTRKIKLIKETTSIIAVEIEKRHFVKWKPFIVRSCNEICRYASGVDIGFTFNPVHLYNKLLKFDGKRNYRILSHWRRLEDGTFRR